MNERPGRPIPRLLRPLQEFLETATAGGVLLLVAVVAALAWVNSPWSASYTTLFATPISVGTGDLGIEEDLRFWINEGLMALFFLTVGLEIKRELTTGELRRPRAALLPAIVAATGMIVPALLYVAIVGGGDGARGWGIPMATDVAFALGVLAFAAARIPSGLRPLLLAIAIVDDIASVIVVGAFYPGEISIGWLVLAVGVAGLLFVFPKIHIRARLIFVTLGVALWYAMYQGGLHPALSGVVVGLLIPSTPVSRPAGTQEGASPLTRVEHLLLPWASFVVLPLFALANMGVQLSASSFVAAAGSAVAWAILVARVGGKLVGIWGGALLASRLRLVEMPAGVGSAHLAGMAAAAGTGFTVSLFVAAVVFGPASPLLAHVKIALLVASAVSALLGLLILRRAGAGSSAEVSTAAAKGT